MQRVIVFIDYQNVHGWARRMFLPYGCAKSDGHIFPLKVAELIVSRRRWESELVEVRVYRGKPGSDRQPGAAGANDRQTSDWERSKRVTVVRRNLDYPRDWPAKPAIEKGIDVAIATDMVRLALDGEVDTAVLFSSDKDLLPAVELLWERPNLGIEVAAWTKANRLRFPGTQLPWCHSLSQKDFESVRDRYDYTQP